VKGSYVTKTNRTYGQSVEGAPKVTVN